MDERLKRNMLVAAAGAGSVVIAAAFLAAVGFWYLSKPKPLKPWNSAALKASFYYVDTEGDSKANGTNPIDAALSDRNIVFYYLVENTTPDDYKVSSAAELSVAAELKEQKSLAIERDEKNLRLDYPIFVPAGQRVLLAVHLPAYLYSPNEVNEAIRGSPKDPWDRYKVPPAPGPDSKEMYRAKVREFVGRELKNLDGFVLFDKSQRYRIDLPLPDALPSSAQTHPCPATDPLGLYATLPCKPSVTSKDESPCPETDPIGLNVPQPCTPLPAGKVPR